MSAIEPEVGRRTDRGLLLRALLGGFLIVALTAGATATAGLLKVHDIVERIAHKGGPHIANTGITEADAGKPQTILILGSDRRWADYKAHNPLLKANNPARSDTIMLVRLDPHQPATSMLSIPRDLKVEIPGHGIDKINDAYSLGGPTLTLETVKALTGLKINHVINVQFRGFREAVDELHCIYVDVDRRYYHSNVGLGFGQRYAEINIQPGYQKLCGTDALSYVRYRHTDSDIVRAARQQDFLRAVKEQVSSSQIFNDRNKLIDIFASSTQTDASLDTTNGLLRILKLALFSAGHPIRQVQFPATFENDTLPGGAVIDYVTASTYSIQQTVRRFLHPSASSTTGSSSQTELTPTQSHVRHRHGKPTQIPGLVDGLVSGEQVVATAAAHSYLGFPLYFPKLVTTTSRYSDPAIRIYTVHDRAGKPHRAYRIVLSDNPLEGQYWGVQGTTWRTPPIFLDTHDTEVRHGRHLNVYRDGARIRLVAWRTPHAVYWVSNSLSLSLTNSQMLEIASTLARRHSAKTHR